jgi:hypothetical protein
MYTGEEHENNLSDLIKFLNVEGVDQAKLSTIIQGLRDNYNEVNTTFAEHTKKLEDYSTMNEGLRSANMSLLSKLGTSTADLLTRDKEQFKKGSVKTDSGQAEETLTLEDISNNFL